MLVVSGCLPVGVSLVGGELVIVVFGDCCLLFVCVVCCLLMVC